MSRSNRLRQLALGGCLAALFLSPASAQEEQPSVLESQPIPESGQDASKGRAEDKGQEKKPTPEQLAPVLDKIEAAIRDLIAQERAAQGQGPKDNEIRDLEAQEGMALWAKAMFWATVAAVLFTFAGIVLIWRTLHHTRRAADYAAAMVAEAKATTEAAEKTIAVAQVSSERQLRAYLHTADQAIKFTGTKTAIIHIKLVNSGQTPAYKTKCQVAAHTFELVSENDIPVFNPGSKIRTFGSIGPNGDAKIISVKMTLEPEYLALLTDGAHAIYAYGQVTYNDTFGSPQWIRFRLFYKEIWVVGREDALSICREGNDAT